MNIKDIEVRPRAEQYAARHEERQQMLGDNAARRWDQTCAVPSPAVRTFESGATRDDASQKLDFEGFLDPDVLHRFAQYMHKHRHQRDGSLRDSDNWQKGIPLPIYMKSLLRHVVDLWRLHRGKNVVHPTMPEDFTEETLCAIIFNAQGYLSEILKGKNQE